MKTRSILFVLLGAFLLASCSVDGAKIASYKLGDEMKFITVGDLKEITPAYLNNSPQWIAGVEKHKQMVYDSLIRPDLVYADMLKKGVTNDVSFTEKMNAMSKQTPLIMLNTYGRNSLTNVPGSGFDTVKASHILISFSEFTNIAGKREKIPAAEYAQILEMKRLKAQNILDKLKKSKNLKKDFGLEAKMSSDDPGSKVKEGDLGLFFPGQMVKEFDDAVFSAKKTGLLPELVKTQFGYHIIYVTEAPKKRTIKQITKSMDKQRASQMTRSLIQKNMTDQQKEAVELFYELDLSNKIVTVGDKSYTVAELPQDIVLLKIKGTDYTWKSSADIIEIFVPDFVTNKSFEQFGRNMGILQNFMFFVEVAKNKKLDQSAEYKKELKKRTDKQSKDIALDKWSRDLRAEVTALLTDEMILNQYTEQKDKYKKQGNKGEQIQMTFKEVKEQIKNELTKSLFEKAQASKDEELKNTYSVTFIQEGLAKYSEELKKKSEQAKKKLKKKKAPPAPKMPQGVPQPNIKPKQ